MTDKKTTASPVKSGELPEVFKDKRRLGVDDTFKFGCHKGLPCFTDCCGDINILLTPLDVLYLARAANLSTHDFIEKHTLTPISKDLHLPVKMLRMSDTEKRSCPFVGPDGCTVYDARPWACRMYPIGMGLPPAHAGETPEPVFFLFEDGFCKGHGAGPKWTVAQWRADQGVEDREDVEEGFRGLMSHPYFIGGMRQLDPKRLEMFHMACYDLDTFRRFVFDSTFVQRFEIEPETVEKMRNDDVELLKFAFVWLRFALFGEPTMKAREDASQTRRPS